MDTPTPNLGLRRFLGLDDFNFTDVNFNSDTTDTAAVITVCTSATRPASLLFNGRRIYETDTKLSYVWDGAAWRLNMGRSLYACRATQTGTPQVLAVAGTYYNVAFNTADYDYASLHSNVTNNSRLTAPIPGLYCADGQTTFASNATGIRKTTIELRGAGARTLAIDSRSAFAGSTTTCNLTAGDFVMAAGEYIEMTAMQNAGANLSLDSSAGATWMTLRLVGEIL